MGLNCNGSNERGHFRSGRFRKSIKIELVNLLRVRISEESRKVSTVMRANSTFELSKFVHLILIIDYRSLPNQIKTFHFILKNKMKKKIRTQFEFVKWGTFNKVPKWIIDKKEKSFKNQLVGLQSTNAILGYHTD